MGNSYRAIYFVIFMITLLVSVQSYAQNDRLFLNNGSTLKGDITAFSNGIIQMKIDSSYLKLAVGDVKYVKLAKKSKLNEDAADNIRAAVAPHFNRGLSYVLSAGLSIGDADRDDGNAGMFSGQGAILYKFLPKLQLGVSLGYDRHSQFNTAPFAIYYQGDISNKPGGLFVYGGLGKAKAWNNSDARIQHDNVRGKKVVLLGLGHSWMLKNIELTTTLGWKRQQVESSNDMTFNDFAPANEFVVLRSINRIETKIGIIF